MDQCENKPLPRWFMVTQLVLRLLTIACTVVSIVVMATSGTTVLLGRAFTMTARYYYSAAFKYLMGVDATVCALVLLSLVPLYLINKTSNRNYLYLLFLHDLVLSMLMVSACGAATAIGYVGIHGQSKTFWLKICNNAEKFCTNIGVSVTFSCLAFLGLFALTVLSSYKLMKRSHNAQNSVVLECC